MQARALDPFARIDQPHLFLLTLTSYCVAGIRCRYHTSSAHPFPSLFQYPPDSIYHF